MYHPGQIMEATRLVTRIRSDDQVRVTLASLLSTVNRMDRPMLREKVTELKQSSAEEWAIGDLLERTLVILDALEYGD